MIDSPAGSAMVTGAASGIGAAAAERLHAEGAKVATLDLAATALDYVLALSGDVSSSQDVDAAVERTETELGPIDVLVCSAGIPGDSLRTQDVDDEEWRRVMAINADGVFYCNRAVAPVWPSADTAASSTSPRSPARRATRWRPRTRPRKPP